MLNIWDGCANPFCDIPANAIDGQWHHYAVIIAPGNTKLYFDSKLCGIANYKDPTGTNFYISSGAGYDWNGQVDDVRIFSTAYTQAQVKQLYADGLAAHHNLAIIK